MLTCGFSVTGMVGSVSRAESLVIRRAALALGTALCMLLVATPAWAHGGAHAPGALPVGHTWDFLLPTLDGSRLVQASALSGPVLVNFFARDCAACIATLPRLVAFAKARPQWTVLLVSTDAAAEAREFLQQHGVQLTVLKPGINLPALMRGAGNTKGGLPFTVGLNAARICEGQLGDVTDKDLHRMATTCAAAPGY